MAPESPEVVELRAALERANRKTEALTKRLAELQVAAQRWETARLHLTWVYQLYARDERHDRLGRRERCSERELADHAVDRVRMELERTGTRKQGGR